MIVSVIFALVAAPPIDTEPEMPKLQVRKIEIGIGEQGVALNLALAGDSEALAASLRRAGLRPSRDRLFASTSGGEARQTFAFRHGERPVFEYVAGERPPRREPLAVPASTRFAAVYQGLGGELSSMSLLILETDTEQDAKQLLKSIGERFGATPFPAGARDWRLFVGKDGWRLLFLSRHQVADELKPGAPRRWRTSVGVVPPPSAPPRAGAAPGSGSQK